MAVGRFDPLCTFRFNFMLPWMVAVDMLVVMVYSNAIHYHEDVVHYTHNRFYDVFNIPPSNLIKVNYHIAFRGEKCCPLIEFLWAGNDETPRPSKYYSHGCRESQDFASLYSEFSILMREGFPRSGCRQDDSHHVCEGMRTVTATSAVKWAIAVENQCIYGLSISLNLTLELEVQYETNHLFQCEPVIFEYCKDKFGFDHTAFPNAAGHHSQLEADLLFLFIQRAMPFLEKHYQHSFLFICRALFPTCHTNHRRLLPCRQMCLEAKHAVGLLLLRLEQPIHCRHFPNSLDPDVCFYEPVQCPQPAKPEFAHIQIEGVLLGNITSTLCEEGYEIMGDPVRHCTSSGAWNSTSPTCILKSELGIVFSTTVLPVLLALLFPLFLSIACAFHHMDNISLRVLHSKWVMERWRVKHGMTTSSRQTLFVTYSSVDRNEVSENFIPGLQQELPGWNVITYQKDFVPGQPILDCIKKGVWESQAVLVLLTAGFIASPMCCYEFIQAQTRSVLDREFKLIVVLFTKDNKVTPMELSTDLPDNLKQYICTRIYLPLGEPLFWNKLRRALTFSTR